MSGIKLLCTSVGLMGSEIVVRVLGWKSILILAGATVCRGVELGACDGGLCRTFAGCSIKTLAIDPPLLG